MHLLFDLDGTLTDSFPGISQSINQTLMALGREVVPLDQLRPFVGARLATIFGSLLQSEDEALIDRAEHTLPPDAPLAVPSHPLVPSDSRARRPLGRARLGGAL